MADLATPSAAEVATSGAADTKPSSKPERPDEAEYKQGLETRQKALDAANAVVKQKSEAVGQAPRPNDETSNQRRDELRSKLDAIKAKQSAGKASRDEVMNKVKALDTQLKSRQNELKNLRAAIPYKSTDEIDQAIARLDKEVESGKMKVVDEKKALTEISNLRKQKKAFSGVDEKAREVDALKARIAETKGTSDKAGNKEEQDEYSSIIKELDAIKASGNERYKALSTHRDALTAAKKHADGLYKELKAYKDEYFSKRNAYRDYEREAKRIRQEKWKSEQEAYAKEKKQHALNLRIEDAKIDAYIDEIRTSTALIRLLDPSATDDAVEKEASKYAATAQRTVNTDQFSGMKVAKREEEDYFAGTGGKKGKKGRKEVKADVGKFFTPSVIEQFKVVGLDPPSSSDEIAPTVEKLKEKRTFWKQDQKRKTQENIDNAQKAFEAEQDSATKANGESSTAEVTEKLASTEINGSS